MVEMTPDRLDAFVEDAPVLLPGAAAVALMGLRFAVKDLFDIAGHVTGCGNPDWRRTHAPATATAPVVAELVAAGATMIGKTQTDELAYSLQGENFHYGTPVNPLAPDRIPGGSSSGSAVAVAGEITHFAIGSDTGGSVRVPAAFCGVLGIRPSHGRIALEGCMPLAPSFDTVGWFARNPALLERVGEVLFGEPAAEPAPPRLLLAEETRALCAPGLGRVFDQAISRIEDLLAAVERIALAADLDAWMWAFRRLQGAEVWQVHGPWIEAVRPRFGPGLAERFDFAAAITPAEVQAAAPLRAEAAARMRALLADGAVLVLPTAPDVAPFKATPAAELEAFRGRTMMLTSIAGLAGLPQISLPLLAVDGVPAGLSIMAGPGRDMALLGLARQIMVAFN